MIDRCDSQVASWSESGDNFVVKDVEKFSCVSDKQNCPLTRAYSLIHSIRLL